MSLRNTVLHAVTVEAVELDDTVGKTRRLIE